MSVPHKDDATVDVLLLPQVQHARMLFESACEEALNSGSRPPLCEEFLKGIGEGDLYTLRQELQRVAQSYEQRLSQQTQLPKALSDLPSPVSDGTKQEMGRSLAPDATATPEFPAAPSDKTANGVASTLTVDFSHAAHNTADQNAALALSANPADQYTRRDESAEANRHEDDATEAMTAVLKEKFKPPQVPGYDVLAVLGRGAMGVVYKARQRGLKRLVALKMILAGDHASARDLARFRIEAEAVAKLHHANIVQIHEIGDLDGKPYFSLEFIDGQCLANKVSGAPLSPRAAADLVRHLALAMQYSHEMGVVHRDLKPGNILLTKDGSPKITDFGLAKRVGEDSGQTQSGAVLGTPSYMPPEQAEGRVRDIGPLSDVYSLGAILYELLTGRAPFKSSTVLDTLQQVRKQEPVSLAELQPGTPRDLETISLKCLQKDPKKRYARAGDLAEDLRRYLANEPILARPTPWYEHAYRWCRRNPVVASLSGGIAALILISLIGSWIGMAVINGARNAEKQAKILANANAFIAQQNEQKANENADKAEREKIRANDNAAAAKKNEDLAKKNEQVAKRNADVALDRQYASVNRGVDMAESFLKNLRRASSDPQLEPQLRPLKEEALKSLRANMTQLAKGIENKDITSFAAPFAHQRMGDMFRNLGMSPEAVEQYQLALDTAKKAAEAQPDEDKGRANWALLLDRLGKMDMEKKGDLPAAREKFQKALALQEDVEANPRSHGYTDIDNKRLKANYLVSLGRASLYAGGPAAARKDFDRAVEYRRDWSKAFPKNNVAKSWLSEAYMLQVDAAGRLADVKEMDKAYKSACEIIDDLTKNNPNTAYDYKADRAEAHLTYADAMCRLGNYDQARECFEKCPELLKAALDKDPESLRYQGLVARLKRGQALTAEKLKDPAAGKHYAEELKWREKLVAVDAESLPEQTAYLVCLARNGKQADAAKKADGLADKVAKDPQLAIDLAGCYAVCAASTQDAAEKQHFVDQAIELLRTATKDGYKDRVNLLTDPNLEPLHDNAAFKEIGDKLKGQ